MGRLDGKVALIGGSLGKIKKGKFSENLGGVIAKDMQDEGAQVVLVDIDDEVAKSCAEHLGGNAVAMECDLMKEREFETVENDQGKTDIVWKDNPALDVVNKIAEDYGKLDILVTAFDEFPRMRKMTKMKEGRYEKMRDGNIFPVFHLLAAVREQFKAQNAQDGSYAKVVMLTHMVGKAGMSMGTLYSAFKGGLIGLNKSMAREFGRFANVNAVAIGPLKKRKAFGPRDRIKSKFMVTSSDMSKQKITFEKIAPMVTFLGSDDAMAISGQTISVDGGLWLKLEQ